MKNEKRLKYTTYVAGPIEAIKKKSTVENARDKIYNALDCEELGIYDPIKMEADKVGKSSKDQCSYIKGLKRAGHWNKFHEEMWKIWFGEVSENNDIIEVLKILRMRKPVDGNYREEMRLWGDFEAVVRSDFLIAHLPNKKTVGTHWEILVAALFRIPVYLILPETTKTEENSTLLFGVEKLSQGKIFYSIKEGTDFIKEKYNLTTKE